MKNGNFPRIRENNFNVNGVFNIPMKHNGRLDLVIADLYGTPTMYKVFAAANNIRNSMALRGTIRPYDECVRNELILKGYSGSDLEREYNNEVNEVIVDNRDWLSYGDNVNGVITDANGGSMKYIVPDINSISTWYNKYNRVQEDEE